jgi:hypothetical protein
MLSFKKLTVFFMGAILFGGTVGATVGTNTATAVTYSTAGHAVGLNFKGGPGHWGTVWAGTYNNGRRGFCLDFGKAMPNRRGQSLVTGNVPGMNAEESKQAKFIANKYDLNGSREASANAGLAIWRLQHDSAFNTWYGWARSRNVITAARARAVDAIILDARQHAAYKMSVSTNQVYVGQTGSGTVKVLGSNGKPAVGRSVALTATGAKILTVNGVAGSKGTTRSTGAVFTYQRTTTDKTSFKVALTSDSSATAQISLSSWGHQRTLSGGYAEGAAATYIYYLPVSGPSIASGCDTDCNGQSAVTFQFANSRGAQAIKWTGKVGTLVVATLSAKGGTTGTAVVSLGDGKVVTSSSYCYTGSVLGGPCTTSTVVVPTSFEIVCPAWAQGELQLPCKCTPNQPASVTLSSPAGSPRFYRGFVSIDKGIVTYPVDLVNGKPTTINTGKLGVGTNGVISFTAYRDAARTVPMGTHILRDITVN